jgi:dinuclear metal center YbgI/SA1388 family protein
MKLKKIISALENWAPPAYQESYDNSRLLTGDKEMNVTGVLVCLDCTEEIIKEAVRKKCNLAVAHHPILFSGLKSLTGKNYVERTIIAAIKKGVAIYALHTNLDNVHTGVNFKIAELLGMKDTKILRPLTGHLMKLEVACPEEAVEPIKQAVFEAGAGNIGNYSEGWFGLKGMTGFRPKAGATPAIGNINEYMNKPEMKLEFSFPSHLQGGILKALEKVHPYEEFDYKLIRMENLSQEIGSGMIGTLERPVKSAEFLKRVKKIFKTGAIRHTDLCRYSIHKVAVCGGAGFFLLEDAVKHGADILITADVKYHDFFDADGRIILADIGHYESEQFTRELIAEKLSLQFPDLTAIVCTTRTNPVNYL